MTWKNFPNLYRQGHISFLTMPDGINLRTASWPSEGDSRGIIVLVNGHREYMEKYSELISDFLKRGFAVYALDNRGQGLSDRLLPDRYKSHSENFDAFSNDLNEFISRVVMTDPRAKEIPTYLVGHSMGGHICLRYLHDFPGTIDKSVVMAPMIEFSLGGRLVSAAVKLIIRLASRIGFGKKFAFGQGYGFFCRERHLIRQKLLTHDDKRYAVEVDIIEAMPDLYAGGATFGWLRRALDSIDKIRADGFLEEISIPVMVVLAGADRIVDSATSHAYFSGHDNFSLVTIEGARHEIYREADQYRDQLWREIDNFLET